MSRYNPDYQRDYSRRNRDRINAQRRKRRHEHRDIENGYRAGWRKRHPETYNYGNLRFWEKAKQIWGVFPSRPPRELWIKIELHALNILPTYGFSSITHFKEDPGFTFDFIATLNGRRCLIDATCAIRRNVKGKVRLARLLDIPFFVVFISPNLRFHYLQDMTNKSSCWSHVPWCILKTFVNSEVPHGVE